jgi:hypothetical protein
LFVRAFSLLQANNVRLCVLKPCKQAVLPFPERIYVPGGNTHRESVISELCNF